MYSKKVRLAPPRRSMLGFGDAPTMSSVTATIGMSPPFVAVKSPPIAVTSEPWIGPTVTPSQQPDIIASPFGIPPIVLLGGAAVVAYFLFGRK